MVMWHKLIFCRLHILSQTKTTIIEENVCSHKLLVEIGSEGGRRHNSPLIGLLSSEGVMAEGPLGDEGNAQ
jgi:hypothetical protein